jgi:DNA-binding GntR family transcriptional regulator
VDSGRTQISRKDSYAEQVEDTILAAIGAGVLKPGSLCSMQTLADQLGVSRTPVREAMLRLQHRGIVTMVRNQGVMILGHSPEDLKEIFQVRRWLEVPAVREAALRADDAVKAALSENYHRMEEAARAGDRTGVEQADRAFHVAILDLVDNARLNRLVSDLRDSCIASDPVAKQRPGALDRITEQHRRILDGIVAGDPEAAAAAMEGHLTETAAALGAD